MTRVVSADARTTTAALTLLYGRWPPAERKLFVREALDSVAKGRLDLRHLVVALDGRHEVVGAALAVERPGREAVVWTPGFQNNVATLELGLAMLTELNRRLDVAGMACAVCFVDRGQSVDRQCLEAAGFPGVADLCLLRGDPQSLLHRPTPRLPALRSIAWSTSAESLFAETIAEIQRDGFDCPEVGPYRSGQDVLDSHGAGSLPEPNLWRLYYWGEAPDPAGVLLLGDHQGTEELEVLYLGVVPKARRQGLARAMLGDARQIAKSRRRGSLTVAVESRNAPALALYAGERFVETRRYAIHLRVNPHATPTAS